MLIRLEWLAITCDLELDLGSGHTAYGCASLIDLYLHTNMVCRFFLLISLKSEKRFCGRTNRRDPTKLKVT